MRTYLKTALCVVALLCVAAPGVAQTPDGSESPRFASARVREQQQASSPFQITPSPVGSITNQVIYPSRVLFGDGTAGAPALAPASAPTNGFYWDGTRFGLTGALLFGVGAASTPTVAIGLANKGFYAPAAGSVGLGISGSQLFNWNSSAEFSLLGAAAGVFFGAGSDVRVGRGGASIVQIGNATTGVQLDASVNGTVRVLAFNGADTGIVRASAYTVGATAGCTGTPTTVTNGIATACSEPNLLQSLQAQVKTQRDQIAFLMAELAALKQSAVIR